MHAFKRREIYSNPEFQSAMVRLGVWVFAIVYISAVVWSERYSIDTKLFGALFALYLLFFSGILISVFVRPVWEGRRYFSLVVDISATTFSIYLTGDATSPFFLLYIWIFVSYGTRYGRRHLTAASTLSIAAYSVVLTFLGQWGSYLFEALFVLSVLALLPIYQHSLMSRLKLARLQAEESNRLMGRFLSNITNDMRAPLGDIIATSNRLAGSELSMRQVDRVEEIISSASLLDAAIGDVLDFSKMEAQQLQVQAVPFNLRDLLLEICSATSQYALIKNSELICSVAAEVPKVIMGDEQRLRQILVNVIKHSLDNAQDGELRVAVRIDPADSDSLLFAVDGPRQTLLDSESEAGANGLDSSDLSSGLGVSLARKLTLMMGGEFWTELSDGCSRFQLKLPAVVNEFEVRQLDDYSSIRGKMVFVFETNSTSREVITKSFEDAGMIVESADRIAALGAAVSESRAQHATDLIMISDPPGGKDVTRIADICLSALGQDLPLVVLAQRSNCLDLDKYSSTTMIRKPVILECLVDKIQAVLAVAKEEGYSHLSSKPGLEESEQPGLI